MTLPNTFLIGAQKAATTSLYSWLSQHPEICAPMTVKDYAFFTRDDFFNNGLESLSRFYEEDFNGEKIVLQGSVHYIYFEKALKRIQNEFPDAKFLLVLRNPVERAISAYEYAVKFNYETLGIEAAFAAEEDRKTDPDNRVRSELTYKSHGLYYKQIKTFLKYFSEEQLKVILYEDIANQPERVVKNTFGFLNVNDSFKPNLESMNQTGRVKNKTFQKLAFGNSKFRNFITRKVMPLFLSQKAKDKLRWKMIHLNTKDSGQDYLSGLDPQFRRELNDFFKKDIEALEHFLSRDLSHWKFKQL